MAQSNDRRTKMIPGVATFHARERTEKPLVRTRRDTRHEPS
jgi:hypothetical protein